MGHHRPRPGKRDRPLYLSEGTVTLWRETVRRARLLADRPGGATADSVLRAACYTLHRQQDRQARLRRIDLAPPPPPDMRPDEPEQADFREVPRPPAY
ncbi:MAG: hypothetical protein EDM82_06855 [Cyanobacteria bacterium CYA]|nr:MAG: hypothetical protein EDM82_06855 [Cyanobacteria bacterium CYA]